MKKIIAFLLCLLTAAAMFGCTKEHEGFPVDNIRNSVAAKMEARDGTIVYVDGEIDSLTSLGYMEFAALEDPTEMEENWTYSITYNPKEKVTGDAETEVLFYGKYLRIGDKCYLPSDGAEYAEILSWAESKFAYFTPTEQ